MTGVCCGFCHILETGEVGKARNVSRCKNIIHNPCHCLVLILAVSVNAGDSLIKLSNIGIPGCPNQASF